MQEIERRISTQAEHIRNVSSIFSKAPIFFLDPLYMRLKVSTGCFGTAKYRRKSKRREVPFKNQSA